MTQTRTAKILVFTTLVLAIGMSVWAFGLYSGRIDWSNKQAKGTEPAGELAKRQSALKEVDNALTVAETRQRSAFAQLRLLEPRRPRDLNDFAGHFAHLQNGINPQKPLEFVSIVNGVIQLTPDGRLVMVPDPKYTQSLAGLAQEQKQTQEALLASITEFQKLVDEDVELTNRMNGDKGLRQQLFDEVDVKQARIRQEIEDLKPLYINVMVESQLLMKRQRALEDRVREMMNTAKEN